MALTAIEKSKGSQSAPAITEVVGIKQLTNKFSYLVLLEDQTTKLLSSEEAKECCPKAILQFYVQKCHLDGGQIHVPKQYNIGI